MKKILTYFIVTCFISNIKAQFGINTNNPSGIFHIDGAKDNQAVGSPNQFDLYNDVVLEKNAHTGIGTLPENNARLTINLNTSVNSQIGKAFRLKDGTEGNGNVLSITNSQGDIAWKKRIATIVATMGTGYNGSIQSDMAFTSTTISLPPGKWFIRSSIVLRVNQSNGTFTDGLFAQLSWADRNTDGTTYSLTQDAVSGNVFGGTYLGVYSLAFGQTIINNTSTATKTYYLITRKPKIWGINLTNSTWDNLAANSWGENAIIAFNAN